MAVELRIGEYDNTRDVIEKIVVWVCKGWEDGQRATLPPPAWRRLCNVGLPLVAEDMSRLFGDRHLQNSYVVEARLDSLPSKIKSLQPCWAIALRYKTLNNVVAYLTFSHVGEVCLHRMID